ncbi:chemotaxis protein CheD [Pelomonas sp. SE-A7]|uniref:chemotaxis protein CheD n=1 Tax=Pelomonas sp. SE-A7 TaxID=3054953 RepID=UPI00259CEABB|nr:chemotaxis protein CheD [Pelomonas sp. SE-A7]MDM4766909.1 chemotaxis protein CheD [Pelomonas sp. SE-A7]
MPESSVIKVYLLPGEHAAGDARLRIGTLLGSCVSVTLWQPQLRVGAMSHFVLPGSNLDRGLPPNGRYAEDSLELMLEDLRQLGARAEDCEAKVFGGGAMFEPRPGRPVADIGRKNGEAAKAMLMKRRIRIVSESLFDAGHRRIVFHVRNGEVWVRHGKPEDGQRMAREYAS